MEASPAERRRHLGWRCVGDGITIFRLAKNRAPAPAALCGFRAQPTMPNGSVLRQTEGLIGLFTGLLRRDLAVPDHSTMSRRAKTLGAVAPAAGNRPAAFAGGQHWPERVVGRKARHFPPPITAAAKSSP
jgi:hypothetical protein